MSVNINKPRVYNYEEINVGQFNGVKHYELKNDNVTLLLSHKLNISVDRSFAKSKPDYWLKIRQGKKWSKCITGLFRYKADSIYFGDLDKKKHLIVFKFSEDKRKLTVYLFENYHTFDLSNVINFIR